MQTAGRRRRHTGYRHTVHTVKDIEREYIQGVKRSHHLNLPRRSGAGTGDEHHTKRYKQRQHFFHDSSNGQRALESISSRSLAIMSATGIAPKFSFLRERSAAVPFSTS